MRSDDARRVPLERAGWIVVAKSWGAQLEADRVDRDALQQKRDSVVGTVGVRELTGRDEPMVLALDAATLRDYPGGVATRHEPLVAERAVPSSARRAFGAMTDDGALVAMTWVDIDGSSAETDFTVVQRSARGRGYGYAAAVKAASLLALLDAGVTRFRTGGSSENPAIIATNRTLGYVFDEEWVTIAPPDPDSQP